MKNINNILVPFDFSEVAENALRFAVEFAKQNDSKIIIFHAYKRPIDEDTFDTDHELGKTEENIKGNTGKLLKKIPELNKTKHEFKNLKGTVVDTVVKEAKEDNIDLIVMGTNGYTGIESAFWGTKSAEISLEVSCPVLIVPPKAQYFESGKVALATDLEAFKNLKILDICKNWVELTHSKMELVHVTDGMMNKQETEQIEKIKNHFQGMNYELHIKHNDNVVYGLIDFIKHHKIDMLILTHRIRKPLENFFHDSVTRDLVIRSKVPLLVLED